MILFFRLLLLLVYLFLLLNSYTFTSIFLAPVCTCGNFLNNPCLSFMLDVYIVCMLHLLAMFHYLVGS